MFGLSRPKPTSLGQIERVKLQKFRFNNVSDISSKTRVRSAGYEVRVWDLEFWWVKGAWRRVQGEGCRVQGAGCRVQGAPGRRGARRRAPSRISPHAWSLRRSAPPISQPPRTPCRRAAFGFAVRSVRPGFTWKHIQFRVGASRVDQA